MTDDDKIKELRKYGEKIKELRKYRGWTQDKLAKESGCSQRMIAGYETGGINPPLSVAVRLARALNCLVDDFRDPPERKE